MKSKIQCIYMIAAVALTVVLAVACSSNSPIAPINSATPETIEGEAHMPPCATGECEPRDVGVIDLFSGGFSGGAAYEIEDTASLEEVLEQGLALAEASLV